MIQGMKMELLVIVFLVLFIFGIGYNGLVAWIEARRYNQGYVCLLVAIGVMATLAGLAVLDIKAAMLATGCFVASGTPMMVGSILRYWREREKAERYRILRAENVLQEELGAETETVAL
jgi:uncharacterized membrane protein YhhN